MAARKRQRSAPAGRVRRVWRRVRPGLSRAALFGLGLSLGGGVPWVLWLDHVAGQRFAERQWSLSSRVYARPLELYPGRALSRSDLQTELAGGSLVPGDPARSGRYRVDGGRYDIHAPAGFYPEGPLPARRYRVTLSGGRVTALTDAQGKAMGVARLPPVEIGSLLPLDARDRTLVRLSGFPDLLVRGIQAVEDRQFGRHHGIDPKAMLRAAWRNLVHGEVVQGGSTITQQLVKNLYLDPGRNLVRKFNEAVMAISLERRFSKAGILEAYLNEVWLGQVGGRAIHGFGRASEHYFGMPVSSLAPEQIALLVGMVRGASWYHPVRNPERARARRNTILGVFHETGLIDRDTLEAARSRPLGVRTGADRGGRQYPAFMDLVQRQLRRDYRDSDLRAEGLRIFTTLSPSAQAHAEAAVAGGPGDDGLQAGLVLADPSSGDIRALVGDRQPRRAGFNRALDARRPVGSVIKPFVYLLALAQAPRFSLVTPLMDTPVRIPVAGREDWTPRNYDGHSHGRVPLMAALVHSYNQATVDLGMQVGVKPLFRLLDQLGVRIDAAPHPSALLGAIELTPMEVAQLYQPLAADGFSAPLRSITAVVDRSGEPIGRYPLTLKPIREREALALVNFALEEVVRTGTAAGLPARLGRDLPVAGKTGTTNDRRDAWFVGYTPDWFGVVWVGRDDNAPAGIGGASTAMPVWAELFRELPVDTQHRTWPDGIEWYWIDWPESQLAVERCDGARALPFIAGSQPVERSSCY